MSRFSKKYGYDKRVEHEIMEDAPEWIRIGYMEGILADLLFIDMDTRYKNSDDRPLGIKALHRDFSLIIRVQLQQDDFDSWVCQENLFYRVKTTEWYHFYDLVELVGKKLKGFEGDYAFEEEKLKAYGFKTYQEKVNQLFKDENVVWRLNNECELVKYIPEIMAKTMERVDNGLKDDLEPSRIHYKKAFKYIFSFPIDTENGIKEIVSAVESVGRILYPKASTLGDVIKELRKEKAVPDLLIPVIEKFYTFANATPAVRHGSNKMPQINHTDAEFVFYVGVALIRYLLSVKEKTGTQ